MFESELSIFKIVNSDFELYLKYEGERIRGYVFVGSYRGDFISEYFVVFLDCNFKYFVEEVELWFDYFFVWFYYV